MGSIIEYILIGIGLAMDAFAVSISNGSVMKFRFLDALKIAIFFGVFQALMPVFGWLAGGSFRSIIQNIDHWIAFGLLAFIGGKMIYEGLLSERDEVLGFNSILEFMGIRHTLPEGKIKTSSIIMLSIATSIDAFAVGITFSVLNKSILIPVFIIGVITFIISLIGVFIGHLTSSNMLEGKAEIIGGLILIGIGIRILITDLINLK
jgi:putative Mn2+ efflux pump MntP